MSSVPAPTMTSKVELSISLRDLPNLDVLSKTDPVVVLYDTTGSRLHEVGRTEIIRDQLNPDFVRKIRLSYYFEYPQNLMVRAYDIDNWSKRTDVSKQEFIGEAFVALPSIIMAQNQTWTGQLTMVKGGSRVNRGKVVITAEQLRECSLGAEFILKATKLDKKDFFGLSDPFIELARTTEGGGDVPVWRSEVHKRTLNVTFREAEVDLLTLCNGDRSRPLHVRVFDWNRSGSHKLIGQATLSVDELVALGDGGAVTALTDPTKQKAKKRAKQRGMLTIPKFVVKPMPTFVSMLQRGLNLHLSVAVDFTASNGHPNDPRSLHAMTNATTPNEYVRAIRGVASVLAPYHPREQFTAMGFGAAIPPAGHVSHCFLLAPGDGSVTGARGIEAAYCTALGRVRLAGPTLFSQLITDRARRAATRGPGHYDVLLILTDGVLTDVDQTIRAIVDASQTPLSIIIVGIGGEDFTMMEVLDADEEPLVSGGVTMSRDIVQFVPFRSCQANQAMLASETLAELPRQVVDYYKYAEKHRMPFL